MKIKVDNVAIINVKLLIYEMKWNKFINQIRAPGGHIQITIMIDTQQQYK
jgi:hypothetical protein